MDIHFEHLLNAVRKWFLVHRTEKDIPKYQAASGAGISRDHYHTFESLQLKCDFGMIIFLKLCHFFDVKPWEVLQIALEPFWPKKK